MRRPIPIIALDVPTRAAAESLLDRLGPAAGFVKVGLQLFTAEGPDVVRAMTGRGCRVFLDLKLHDIPNTVAHAVESAARLGVDLLTVHASGGAAMLRAARQAAGERGAGGYVQGDDGDRASHGDSGGGRGIAKASCAPARRVDAQRAESSADTGVPEDCAVHAADMTTAATVRHTGRTARRERTVGTARGHRSEIVGSKRLARHTRGHPPVADAQVPGTPHTPRPPSPRRRTLRFSSGEFIRSGWADAALPAPSRGALPPVVPSGPRAIPAVVPSCGCASPAVTRTGRCRTGPRPGTRRRGRAGRRRARR